MQVTVILVVFGALGTVPKDLKKKKNNPKVTGNQRKNGNRLYDRIVRIDDNTKRSPGELW